MVIGLRKFIYDPVIVACVENNNSRKTPLRFLLRRAEKNDGKFIAPAAQKLAVVDLVRGRSRTGKQPINIVAICIVLGVAAQHHDASFNVTALPSLQKAVSGR